MKKSILLFFLVLIASSNAFAQRDTDLELWLKLGGKVSLSEKWRLDLEEQLRFDEAIGAVKNYHTEVEIKYKFTKDIDLIFVNRFIRRNDNSGDEQGYENHIRFQFGGAYEHEGGQFRFKHRLLFQHQNEMGIKKDEGDVPEKIIRYKLSTEYKIKNWKYDPQFSFEYFNALDQEFSDTNSKMRFGIGTERDYDKLGEFGIDYQIDFSVGLAIKEIAHIISLKYTYSF